MDKLEVGRIVSANFSIGRHPGIVLSTVQEIEDTGLVLVVAISENRSKSNEDDLIEVPHGLGMKKKCWVQCGVVEMLRERELTAKPVKAWPPFLDKVQRQVIAARDRARKSTQS